MTDGPRLGVVAGSVYVAVPGAIFGIQDWENLGVNHGASGVLNSDNHPYTLGT